MIEQVKSEDNQHSSQIKKVNTANKARFGRWSQKQSYLFQILLQRYGKNWKIIQEHMKYRSLAQIRSHAQKYFQKIGPKKVEEFQRRAKLLQALETLKNQKCLKQDPPRLQDALPSKGHEKEQNQQKQPSSQGEVSSPKISTNSESLQITKIQALQNNVISQAPIFYAPNFPFIPTVFDNNFYQTLLLMQHQYLLNNSLNN